VFTRFELPITVSVTGNQPASLQHDLTRLLNRLRSEARIDIHQTQGQIANITINAVPRSEIRSVLPQAACFVAPNVSSMDEYRKARKSKQANWSQLRERTRLAIFLPNDVSPQEVRDCLHEINPRGENIPATFQTRTPIQWKRAIESALGPAPNQGQRLAGANEALRIATAMGWQDQRRAFAHYAMGRVLQRNDPAAAHQHYVQAKKYYDMTPGTRLHLAYVATQLSAFAISQGAGAEALALIAPHVETARLNENAALLSTLMLLRAEALDLENRTSEARAVRLDSLGWARYGFGSDWAVRAKLREIASLSPLKR
jgi:hypothetical protein